MSKAISSRESKGSGRAIRVAIVIALSALIAVFSWLMDRASIRVELDAYLFSYGFLVNSVPAILVFLLLLTLCNRALLSLIISLTLVAVVYAANMMKLRYLDVPVAFSDVYLLGNLHAATVELLANYVNLRYVVAGLVAIIGLFALSFWLEPVIFRRRSIARAIVAVLVVSCMVGIGSGSRWVGRIYGADNLRVIAWSPMQSILHSGLFSSIVYTSAERRRALEVPVNQQAVDAFLKLDVGPALPEHLAVGQRPDIVVVQSESFFDPGILKDVDDTSTILPNLHRALASGIGGSMEAPTFGGGTLRTEFEVLTGIPMETYPAIEFPYLQITQKAIPSIIDVARNNGYAAVAIHGNDGNFWNRAKAFKAIGFDKFITADDFPRDAKRDGWYYADSAMTDQIIDQLGKASKPTLIFAISIEAHGPYLHVPTRDQAQRAAIPIPSNLSGKEAQEYGNYLYHIENADTQLGRLWDFLATRKRPYVLVFYGDHLPGLQHVYKAAEFDDGKTGPTQFVPWFVVGSDLAHANRHVQSWMIGSEILRAAGIRETPYYRLIAKSEVALQEESGARHEDEVMQGIYSLARLYLKGGLEKNIGESPVQGTLGVQAGQNH